MSADREQRRRRRRFAGAASASLAAHLALLAALLSGPVRPPQIPPPPSAAVEIVAWPQPAAPAPPAPAPAAPAAPAQIASPKPPPPRSLFRRAHAPAKAEAPATDEVSGAASGPGLTEAELAGAASVGSGGGGGGGAECDMARRVQEALRRDPLVQATLAHLGGKAVMIWNGDWVWLAGEDGKGLAAVRQAMMWEIAFAPEACRRQAMHGLIVLSPSQGGGARLALGLGAWRWSDLLNPHPTAGGG